MRGANADARLGGGLLLHAALAALLHIQAAYLRVALHRAQEEGAMVDYPAVALTNGRFRDHLTGRSNEAYCS